MNIHPLTPERWADLELLFGPRGAVGGCWCMWNRQTSSEYEAGRGEPNRTALRSIVDSGRIPGLIAYEGLTPVGWVSLGPRAEFGRLQRSPITKPVDDRPVWSIVCFFIPASHRGKGVGKALLAAAIDFARSQGAEAIEGYPIDPTSERMPDLNAWTGIASMFEEADFVEISRPKPTRPIYRRTLQSEA